MGLFSSPDGQAVFCLCPMTALQLLNGGIAIFSLEIISPMWHNDN